MAIGRRLWRRWVPALVGLGACQPAPGEDAEQSAQSPPSVAPAPSAPLNVLTCSYPVVRGDTAESLQARFAGAVRPETLGGAEGFEFDGLALWPDDPSRRLEVFFGEEGPKTVSFVRLGEKAEWRVAGLGLHDPLSRVREVNGKPVSFWGFGWDYGGYQTGLAGGRLADLPGGCTLSLRFDVPEAAVLPDDFNGEVTVSSDDPRTRKLDVRLIELGLGFPAPDPEK